MTYRHDTDLDLMDWFCGAGGSSRGAHAVPGLNVARAANHWDKALESHLLNFPDTDHYQGDIREAPVHRWPVAKLFWASPECPKWSNARGKKRDFHNTAQGELPGLEKPRDVSAERSRALMDEVPQYLAGVRDRGGLVLAGVVENVVECRAWDEWDRWLRDIRNLGYKTRVIALNSMHVHPRTLPRVPQSRDRLYVAYWHESIGRDPDWDKWLRPRAWCKGCDREVDAMQVFKRPGRDMGRYGKHGQYEYRCPNTRCRNAIVEPGVLPAYTAIDWSIAGTRIGDREHLGMDKLADNTLARIRVGIERYGVPTLVPAGGTWRNKAVPVTDPMPTRTTRENDGVLVPPLLIPVEGRDGKQPGTAYEPLRTQTARNETGLAWWPFIAELRGGSSDARTVDDPLAAVCASGNHHGLVTPPGAQGILVPYYSNGTPRPVTEPIGTIPTTDRWSLLNAAASTAVDDALFRMLEPHEIGRGMAFPEDYRIVGNKRDRVRQYGNAVTPAASEVLIAALTECITGAELSREETAVVA